MVRKNNKKVKNTLTPKNRVSNSILPEVPSNLLIFDFSYKNWLRSIKNGKFTNHLKDDSQFASFIFELLHKILPTVQENWNVIKTNQQKQFPHCHTIPKEKIKFVEKIVESIHGKRLLDSIEDDTFSYWQLGISQSVRLIAIYNNRKNVMYPLFIDYHHLIHKSVKYNQTDYDKFSFCPYCKYEKKVAVSR